MKTTDPSDALREAVEQAMTDFAAACLPGCPAVLRLAKTKELEAAVTRLNDYILRAVAD